MGKNWRSGDESSWIHSGKLRRRWKHLMGFQTLIKHRLKVKGLTEDWSSSIDGILLTVACSFQRVALVTILDLTAKRKDKEETKEGDYRNH